VPWRGCELRELVAELAGMARVQVRIEVDPARLRPADTPWLVGDPTRAARETGWRAHRELSGTLATTCWTSGARREADAGR
jgi:GDP-4-dehydro-6-deoxy-D-mannose reductase